MTDKPPLAVMFIYCYQLRHAPPMTTPCRDAAFHETLYFSTSFDVLFVVVL
jgi:hypothetical protein